MSYESDTPTVRALRVVAQYRLADSLLLAGLRQVLREVDGKPLTDQPAYEYATRRTIGSPAAVRSNGR